MTEKPGFQQKNPTRCLWFFMIRFGFSVFWGQLLSCKLKGQPFVMVVVHLSVIKYVLWLNGAR